MQTQHKTAAQANCGAVFVAVREYLGRGYIPIPLPPRTKKPTGAGWPNIRVSVDTIHEHFTETSNVGLLLGGGLVDIDLDALEAVRAAPYFLPETERKHGRPGKRCSHWWYFCKRPTNYAGRLAGNLPRGLRWPRIPGRNVAAGQGSTERCEVT
jgi:hypothetical protein